MGSSLFDEVAGAMKRDDLEVITFEDETLEAVVDDLSEIRDEGAAAMAIARVLARIAAALPRG